jgi:hypothetical protein
MLELTELRMLQQGPAARGRRCHDLQLRMHLLPGLHGDDVGRALRELRRRAGRPSIGEEAPFLVGLKAPVGEAGEMQRGPEAIAAVGLCPAAAAVVAGLMPQNTTSRSSARTSGSYVAKAAPDLPAPRALRPCDPDLWGRRSDMSRATFFSLSVDRG